MDRRELLVVSQLGAAAVAGALAAMYFTGHLTIWYIVAGALLLGLTYTFALPVFSALVPSLVEDHQAKSALMMNTVSYNVGRAVAPVLGIGLVTKIGFTAAFLINSLSFLVLAGFLCTLAPRSPQEPEGRESAKDGFSVAWKNKRILLVLFMVALATVATDPPNVLGPALAQSTFKVPDTWAGVFIAAMGMGNILGSLLRIRKAALRHAALSLCVVGAGMVLFSTGISLWITVAGALLSGIGSLLTGATAQSLIVKYTTPDQRGRVMAVWAIAFAGSRPIASAVDTSIASFASPQIAGVLMAIPALATGCLALPPAIRLGQGFFASGKFTPQSLKPLPDGRVHHLWNQSAKRARKIRADLAASWPQRM
jgi:MFS family permease